MTEGPETLWTCHAMGRRMPEDTIGVVISGNPTLTLHVDVVLTACIHSLIPDTSLQVHYYSEARPTTALIL